MALYLLRRGVQLGLRARGVSFHVGSQQTDPRQWTPPILATAQLFRKLAREGVKIDCINLGGGFPAHYDRPVPPMTQYAEAIERALQLSFGKSRPEIMLEPGRSVVADAGVIQAEVVLIARKSITDSVRWVFLDIGKFGGLMETMDECIRYRLRTRREGTAGPVILAGPTCDSADILYEKIMYNLPLDLSEGDRLDILSTGAYTSPYSAVNFNGFAPLRTLLTASGS
jgi:ornithine decarboxylase